MDPAVVAARYADCLRRIGVEERDYPLPLAARQDGAAHVDFAADGAAEIVVTERGAVLSRQRCADPDRLLYRLMVDVTYDLAWRRQQGAPAAHRDPGRSLFALQRSLMARLDPLWAGWLEADHAPWRPDAAHTPPPPVPPEAASRPDQAALAGLAAGGLMIAMLLAAHLWLFLDWRAGAELSRVGARIQAEVTALTPHRAPGQADRWRVRYRFVGPDGRALERSEPVDRRTFDSLRPGDPVTVRYRPGRPAHARLARNDRIADQAFALLLVDLALVLAGVAIWRTVQRL